MSIIDTLDAAGLTGRGGAAFRTAIKVSSTVNGAASLIVNACDGEIGAAKDGHVVAHHLDELVRGAALVSPRPVRYAAHRGSSTARRLTDAGLDVLEVPDRYVSSEESSLVSAGAGGLARPLDRPRPIAYGATLADGTRVEPTVVLNAETIWRIDQIVRRGARWFRSYGTAAEPGPRLVSVGGAVTRPGIVEAAAGVPLMDIIAATSPSGVGAVAVSGLSGGWLTRDEARTAVWSNAELARFAISTGAGSLQVLAEHACPLPMVRQWLAYAAGETAGQCGPCMFGVPAVARELIDLIDGRRSTSTVALRRRVESLRGRGACRFPDGVAGFVASVLRAFPDLLADHAHGACRRCAHTPAHHPAHTSRGNERHVALSR